MNKYTVKLLPRAARDLDEVYNYIADEFKEIGTAQHMSNLLEEVILSLDIIPYRGAQLEKRELSLIENIDNYL